MFDSPVGYNSGPGNFTTYTLPFISATSTVLTDCSPAINTGSNEFNSTILDGLDNSRLVGGRIDMGALEFQGTPQEMYTINTGFWDDPAIWSFGRLPLLSDPVQIKHIVTIPPNYEAQALRISYDLGKQLLLGSTSAIKFGQ